MARYTFWELRVLVFPVNQFVNKELKPNSYNPEAPGTSECERAYFSKHVPGSYTNAPVVFDHTHVFGEETHDLYRLLQGAQGNVTWNYHKFLLDGEGKPVMALPTAESPTLFAPKLEALIGH